MLLVQPMKELFCTIGMVLHNECEISSVYNMCITLVSIGRTYIIYKHRI